MGVDEEPVLLGQADPEVQGEPGRHLDALGAFLTLPQRQAGDADVQRDVLLEARLGRALVHAALVLADLSALCGELQETPAMSLIPQISRSGAWVAAV